MVFFQYEKTFALILNVKNSVFWLKHGFHLESCRQDQFNRLTMFKSYALLLLLNGVIDD